jgi:hypothetical protein
MGHHYKQFVAHSAGKAPPSCLRHSKTKVVPPLTFGFGNTCLCCLCSATNKLLVASVPRCYESQVNLGWAVPQARRAQEGSNLRTNAKALKKQEEVGFVAPIL